MARRNLLPSVLKAGISIGLMAILVSGAGLRGTADAVRRMTPGLWLLCAGIYVLGQMISAYRWKLLAGIAGFRVSLREHVSFYFIGMFFSLFLPTSVGGDGIKCWYLSRRDPSGRTAPALYTVLAERITGFFVMVWLGAAALYLVPANGLPEGIYPLAGAAAVGVLVTPFLPALLGPFAPRLRWLGKISADTAPYWRRPGVILRTLAWSLAFHSLLVAIHIIIGHALKLPVPAVYYAVVYPAASLAGFLPVSLNGIGPREAAYVYFLGVMGVGRSDALAFGVCWLGVVLAAALPGAVLYLVSGKAPEPKKTGVAGTETAEVERPHS